MVGCSLTKFFPKDQDYRRVLGANGWLGDCCDLHNSIIEVYELNLLGFYLPFIQFPI